MTRLTVPISAEDPGHADQQIRAAAAAGAEMLELRTDYLENLTVETVRALMAKVGTLAGPEMPMIVTCRDGRQGGARPYPNKLRMQVLTAALKAGADFIDCEYENFRSLENQEKIRVALSQSSRGRLILSAHNFKGRFPDIRKLHRDIQTVCPPAIPKLVYTANHINDCFEALDFLHQTSGERIAFCMGESGLMTRILAAKLGSFVTFASVDRASATAPGQLTIEQLTGLYRYASIGPATSLYGVIADPVGHSLSPAIHNACFESLGVNSLYLPLLVGGGYTEFYLFMRAAELRKYLHFGGFSVTIPHKQNALGYVMREKGIVEPLASKIGAVNTLVLRKEDRLEAYNTDYAGALDAITAGTGIGRENLKALAVAVIGAGGVARAIVAGLSDAGARITIYNRTREKARKLASEFGCDYGGLGDLPEMDAELLINCTSVGMHPNIDETPAPDNCIRKGMTVFDTVYNPAETLLLKQAKHVGARTIDGVSMFVNQALAQFRLFTGRRADPELMRATLCRGLADDEKN